MKEHLTLAIVGLFLLLSNSAWAQEIEEEQREGLFTAKKFESDAFVEMTGQFTTFTGSFAAITRFGLTWVINHRWTLNGTYDILTTNNDVSQLLTTEPIPPTDEKVFANYQSAGLKFGYIFWDQSWFSLHPEWKFAWGQVKYEYPEGIIRHQNFYVGEPMVNAVFNVSDFFRVGASVGWRYALSVDLNGIETKDINGFGGGVFIRVGQF